MLKANLLNIEPKVANKTIDVLPKSIPLPNSTWIGSKPLTEQIKVLSQYVVLIKIK